jgi:hypothetical protein
MVDAPGFGLEVPGVVEPAIGRTGAGGPDVALEAEVEADVGGCGAEGADGGDPIAGGVFGGRRRSTVERTPAALTIWGAWSSSPSARTDADGATVLDEDAGDVGGDAGVAAGVGDGLQEVLWRSARSRRRGSSRRG